MGCTACTEMCGNEKDTPKMNNEFLLIAQQKAMFLRKTFSKPQQKKFLNEYFSDDELNIILHLMSLEEVLRPQQILLPEAGELAYLSSTRRTLWKLYSFDILVYEYTKNTIIPPFTQDFSTVKLSQKAEHRFYEIGLDINRTFPTIKHLNRDHLSLVLKNLTLYFDGVGYTQGMNFLVGFMLLCGFEPRQAYWLFIHLSFNQNFLLVRNFTQGFKNVLFMIKVFEEVMEKDIQLSKIKEKVDEMGLTSFFYSFSWFLCYFLYSLESKSCVLIWDFILTFDSRKLNPSYNIKIPKQTQKGIQQKSQLETQLQRKHQLFPQYFEIIHNQRGSILNVIYLAFELMKYLTDQIHESESAEQLLKILRNQNLIGMITPQMVGGMIERIKKGETFEQNLDIRLDWKYFVERMRSEDKELYEIQTTETGHRKFVDECLGLRRSDSNSKQTKGRQIKVQPKQQK